MGIVEHYMLFRRSGQKWDFFFWEFWKRKITLRVFENHRANYFINFLKKHMFYIYTYEHTHNVVMSKEVIILSLRATDYLTNFVWQT